MHCSALDSNKFKLKLPDLTAGVALFLFSDKELLVGTDTSEGNVGSADSLSSVPSNILALFVVE